ncbi:4-hydroxy-tetrahydrodipicolinate reductase [Companilactobacillus halodurans]|uniref:4-hydroxy-tetrahydrodipicolinate reductase n=1 Tax=Companilactobacillus halodurans TaxID=2584183 RepID=A0A5P0ZUC8_9LACO|nr:4-hydroxy-tetrahydrodipicolinate reductase [Companilactobacillus halodurans]MQS75611.1 4-hydroxy-tetrahydrodipicolinate reductase [Companilactobacillus halodurans]MQS96324.1 4-hydroxy-tetrahydrodipicolinate reductase [Companilactobacillus halodurans]
MIKVIISGFNGSMGQKAVNMVNSASDMQLVAGYNSIITDLDPKTYGLSDDVKVFNKLADINIEADIWIDFSVPSAVFENTKFAIEQGIRPVIGTSGMSEDQTSELKKLADSKELGGIIASNFGLSAVLMMKFAQVAAKYFSESEIVEKHHEDKIDAPSGTAMNTARLIYQARGKDQEQHSSEDPLHTRGGDYHGTKIHALRLPGFVADEEVIFGGVGETLTISQSTSDRESFMTGVKLAIHEVMKRNQLVIGLEQII